MKTLTLVLFLVGTFVGQAQHFRQTAVDLGLQNFHKLATSETYTFATATKQTKSDVIVRFGPLAPQIINTDIPGQIEPAPPIFSLGVVSSPSEQIITGLFNEIRLISADQRDVLFSQSVNRRSFLFAGSSSSSVAFVAKSDTVLGSDTTELGVPVSKVAREIEIWSVSHGDATLAVSFDSNSRIKEITVSPVILENTVYIPFFARNASDPSRLISIAGESVDYITTPVHPTIQNRDAVAATLSDDSLLVFVYLGGATYLGEVVPNLVVTFDPFTREFDLAENEFDWREVSSVCAMQGRIFVATDNGVYAGPLHAINRFDLKELGQEIPSYPWLRDMKCAQSLIHLITSDTYYRVPISTSHVIEEANGVPPMSYRSDQIISCTAGTSIVDIRGQVVKTCRDGGSIAVSGLSNNLYILLQPGLDPQPFLVVP